MHLYAPEFLIDEFEKYRPMLLSKSTLMHEVFDNYEKQLFSRIGIVPDSAFSYLEEEAREFSPDPDDFRYFELALGLDLPIWSNDRMLKKQEKVEVYTTEELVHLL
ncbi:MAG: PIN domain-containing protein [Candidatus Micrarchaeota archaeon]